MSKSEKIVRAAALSVSLLFGCQTHHHATTQIAVAPRTPTKEAAHTPLISSTPTQAPGQAPIQTPTRVAPQAAAQATPAATAKPAVVESSNAGAMSRASSQAGQVANEAARETGHGVAVAGRATGHVAMEAGRTTVEIFTKSAVPIRNSPPESLSAPKIEVDEAMQARDWDRSTAQFANSSTVAGPIGFMLEPAPNQPQWRAVFVEPTLFGINTVLMPFDFFRTPPWKAVEWKGASIEPTYTAVPPLPAENAP